MSSSYLRAVGIIGGITVVIAVALSVLWRVPYIFTFVGVATLALIGHFVTIDDDLPGGWSNPDGSRPFPWRELMIKVAIVLGFCLAALVPAIRALGEEVLRIGRYIVARRGYIHLASGPRLTHGLLFFDIPGLKWEQSPFEAY